MRKNERLTVAAAAAAAEVDAVKRSRSLSKSRRHLRRRLIASSSPELNRSPYYSPY